ncbi:hypothetical protein [Streptosporangium longisporum]|uniref:Uncharacterized protein n=1 Tax=Streptosporangium longisporum TaxID=46187 RepID=A0ABP6KYY4_9ACTN
MDDLNALLREYVDDLSPWGQARRDATQTIACSVAEAEKFRRLVEEQGMAGIITVVASPIVPDGTVYVMDMQAMDETLQQQWRSRGGMLWP